MDFHFLVMEKSCKINVGKEGAPCCSVAYRVEFQTQSKIIMFEKIYTARTFSEVSSVEVQKIVLQHVSAAAAATSPRALRAAVAVGRPGLPQVWRHSTIFMPSPYVTCHNNVSPSPRSITSFMDDPWVEIVVSAYRYIASTTLAIIVVFLEYLRQFLIDLHQTYRHSVCQKTHFRAFLELFSSSGFRARRCRDFFCQCVRRTV